MKLVTDIFLFLWYSTTYLQWHDIAPRYYDLFFCKMSRSVLSLFQLNCCCKSSRSVLTINTSDANDGQPNCHVTCRLFDEHRSTFSALRLSDHLNRPQIIEEGNNFDDLARGMHTQPQQASDKFFTEEVSL